MANGNNPDFFTDPPCPFSGKLCSEFRAEMVEKHGVTCKYWLSFEVVQKTEIVTPNPVKETMEMCFFDSLQVTLQQVLVNMTGVITLMTAVAQQMGIKVNLVTK